MWLGRSAITPSHDSRPPVVHSRAGSLAAKRTVPSQKGHRHAFWLPEPDGAAGCLHGCTVWFPDGGDGVEQRELDALLGIRRIFHDDDYPILIVAERVTETCPAPVPSRRWRSLTPFLAPVRRQRRGRRDLTPTEELRRMIEETTGASPRVTTISGPGSLGRLTKIRTHLYQRDAWRWTRRVAAWFELEFDHPVVLPRPVGADAHFGLGRFVPEDAQTSDKWRSCK